MLEDITGTVLTPGNNGRNCKGNGTFYDESGILIECCCDECDYALCCLEDACMHCKDQCPNSPEPRFFSKTR